MARIIGLAGSLRAGSYNAALLRAAREVAPEGSDIEIASMAEVPLYNFDMESVGMPEGVTALKDRVAGAQGLLLVTPEYNNSIPGVFKNTIDWLSRPPKDIPRVFGGKRVAIMGASSGRGGTRLSQAAWLPVLKTLGTRPWFGKQLYVADSGQVFDANGILVDERVRKLLTEFMAGFVAFVNEGP